MATGTSVRYSRIIVERNRFDINIIVCYFINYSRHPNLSDPMTPFGVSSHGILDGCLGFMTSAWFQSLITMMAHSVSPAVRFGVVFLGGLAFTFVSIIVICSGLESRDRFSSGFSERSKIGHHLLLLL